MTICFEAGNPRSINEADHRWESTINQPKDQKTNQTELTKGVSPRLLLTPLTGKGRSRR
jgi:hypothetical protein